MRWFFKKEGDELVVKSAKKYGVTIRATDRFHPYFPTELRAFEIYHNDKLIGDVSTNELLTIISKEVISCELLDEVFCVLEDGVEKLNKELNKRKSK